jgi:C4-dicarboxylate transporter DctM subunit
MIVLVVTALALLVVAVPVAFSIAVGTIAGFIVLDVPLELIAQKMLSGIEPFPFVAIPLFILAGGLMETGGISRRLVALATALVGSIRGGLGMVVVLSEILFSGISGSSVADASAIGSILIPSMVKAGYPAPRAVSIVAAASGMGILIPPCLVMVVLGAMSGLSISALFIAGFIPGLLMGLALLGTIYVQARCGVLPGVHVSFSWARTRAAFVDGLLPLGMPVILFGGILGGVTTATEAAVLAVLYALLLDRVVYREIAWRQFTGILVQTGMTTGAVSLLAGVASAMSWSLATRAVPEVIAATLSGLTDSRWVILALVAVTLIVFSAVLDGLPALIIFFPILASTVARYGVDPLHFGLLSVAALGIGLIVPPIGLLLVIVCQIGGVGLTDVIRPMIPYVLILFMALLLISYVPWLVLVLPRALLG